MLHVEPLLLVTAYVKLDVAHTNGDDRFKSIRQLVAQRHKCVFLFSPLNSHHARRPQNGFDLHWKNGIGSIRNKIGGLLPGCMTAGFWPKSDQPSSARKVMSMGPSGLAPEGACKHCGNLGSGGEGNLGIWKAGIFTYCHFQAGLILPLFLHSPFFHYKWWCTWFGRIGQSLSSFPSCVSCFPIRCCKRHWETFDLPNISLWDKIVRHDMGPAPFTKVVRGLLVKG